MEGDAEGCPGRLEGRQHRLLPVLGEQGGACRASTKRDLIFFIPPSLFLSPVHFFTYDREFITQYCQVSALLELESLLSQQSLREAFSDTELSTAKQRHQQVQDYIQVHEAGGHWEGARLDGAHGTWPGQSCPA